jgi:DNA-binding PadR family transcriptional regulator
MRHVTDDPGLRHILTDLAFHILIALGNGPAHGYAIGKDVEEQSGGRLDPSTGTLYQALHRLHEDGLIASVKSSDRSDERRKYFQLTERGRKAVATEGSATSWTRSNGAKAKTLRAPGLNGPALPLVDSCASRRPTTRVRSRDRGDVRAAVGRCTENGVLDVGARLRARARGFDPVAGFSSSRAPSAEVAPLTG